MNPAMHFHSETFPIPLYSVLISHKGICIQEEYFSPCTSESLHRMFGSLTLPHKQNSINPHNRADFLVNSEK